MFLLEEGGGSLRLFACHADCDQHEDGPDLDTVRDTERGAGLGQLSTYTGFATRVTAVKNSLLTFLAAAKRDRAWPFAGHVPLLSARRGTPDTGHLHIGMAGLPSAGLTWGFIDLWPERVTL